MNKKLKFLEFYRGVHIAFFIFVISALFWLQWFYLLIIFAILRIQDYILGGCILTKLEFGTYKGGFHDATIGKYYPNWMKKNSRLYNNWLLPALFVAVAFFIQ